MKKTFLLFFLALTLQSFSQVAPPEAINYQAVARDAGGNIIITAIGVKFEIHQGSATGTIVYDETHTIIPSSVGIFTAAIGRGILGIGTFSSSINWGTDRFFLEVSIDPAGGTSYSTVGVTELLSVPYALYAKTSGNAGTTYSAGAGISISSGSIINIAMNQTVNISGAGSTTVSGTYPTFLITTPNNTLAPLPINIQVNSPHTTTTLSPGNFSINVQPTNITATTGIATINGAYPNYNVFVPPPVLTVNGGTITITQGPASSTQTFGIAGPWYKPSASVVSITGVNDNVGIGTTIPANRLQVIESNAGNPAIGAINNYTVAANANAMGIYASSANSHSISAGVYGTHSGGGVGVSGINTSTTNSTAGGVYGLVMASFTTAVGVEGYGTGAAIGIKGTSSGNGVSIYGTKPAGSSGSAGKFDNLSTTNPADALFAFTNGLGAAIHAVNGPTVAGSSNVAVWLEAGHLKSTSTAAPTQFSVTPVGGFTMPSFAPTCVGTDVKGVVSFSTSATGFAAINFIDVQFNFQKAYAVPPTVLLTPTTDFRGLSFMLAGSSTTGFTVRVYRPNGATFPTTLATTFFNFNYFIIE